MELIWQGFRQAVLLLLEGDPMVVGITLLSLKLSGAATLCALALGLPIGTAIAFRQFPGRGFLVALVNTGMGLPTVAVGLLATIMLWRSGPLGFLEMLYTPGAIVLAQFIIAFPVITALTLAAMQQVDPNLRLQLLSLGASRFQLFAMLLWETRLPLLAAVMAGFGVVFSEVGAVMMVGGNILGYTRVLTTATVLETRKGNFDIAIALSLILLTTHFVIAWMLTTVQQRGARR